MAILILNEYQKLIPEAISEIDIYMKRILVVYF